MHLGLPNTALGFWVSKRVPHPAMHSLHKTSCFVHEDGRCAVNIRMWLRQYTVYIPVRKCGLDGDETVNTHNLQRHRGALAIFVRVSSSFWILEGNKFWRLPSNYQEHVKNNHAYFEVLEPTPILEFRPRKVVETLSSQQNVRNGHIYGGVVKQRMP